MRHRLLLIGQGVAVGVVVLLFTLLVWSLVSDKGGSLAAAAARGERPQAPDFTLDRLDTDGGLALSSLRGKAVVLNFWGSWCYACRAEAPYLEELWHERRGSDVVVVGYDFWDFRGDARRFMHRYRMSFPVVYDGPGDGLSAYGVTGAPETYVLDREGRVVDAVIGAINTAEDRGRLRTAIDEALS
jgi:cytochrome c biogenesis protein CcmG/thiol:disulfide interchange protein DsbE